MKYTVPDYYREFHCIAGDCPATCCAGWQIMIDKKTLKKYKTLESPFGNRLRNSIDWDEEAFQQYETRCAFLNENNLCDIYIEVGPDMLCRTCRRYPRHIEEYENERELSLSVSCPVVAELILGKKDRACFLEKENEKEEKEDTSFDLFLYSALQDCREKMFRILQDREKSVRFRIAKVLAMAHDIQNRINGRNIFQIEEVLERYMSENADQKLAARFRQIRKNNSAEYGKGLFSILAELEVLDPAWPDQIKTYSDQLYANGTEAYNRVCEDVQNCWSTGDEWTEIEAEQLMVYFIYTYFCGAAYDGDVFAKVKMAVVSVLLLREMEIAAQSNWSEILTLKERARITWRYSRELEHSDPNLNKMEELMNKKQEASFEVLMEMVLSGNL